jgi:hypothetical protein
MSVPAANPHHCTRNGVSEWGPPRTGGVAPSEARVVRVVMRWIASLERYGVIRDAAAASAGDHQHAASRRR